MYPHRIRLRGPWECEPLARFVFAGDGQKQETTNDLPAPRKMTMPCRWGEGGLVDFSGQVRFRRHFGYPGRIDEHESVWLTFAGVEQKAEIWLNDQLLGRQVGDQPWEFNITKLLAVRNHLRVEVESESPAGGLWGEVALEIRIID
jgi:beta-galactosidase/beta-glucuronidase